MTTQATPVDLTEYHFQEQCDRGCGRDATVVARGCMDKAPALLCDQCLKRGLEVISNYVHMYQRTNKKVLICGDCHRPILNLDTHLDVRLL